MNAVEQVVTALLANNARRATKYLSERQVVKASRKLYRRKLPRKGSTVEIVLTVGRPNYEEREFIRRCKAAGEPLPVRKVQLKFPPKAKSCA